MCIRDRSHTAALRFVAELPDVETHYEAAREMARLVGAADANDEYREQAGAWRQQALAWLGKAIAEEPSRWDRAVKDPAFAELVETEAFQKLRPD